LRGERKGRPFLEDRRKRDFDSTSERSMIFPTLRGGNYFHKRGEKKVSWNVQRRKKKPTPVLGIVEGKDRPKGVRFERSGLTTRGKKKGKRTSPPAEKPKKVKI